MDPENGDDLDLGGDDFDEGLDPNFDSEDLGDDGQPQPQPSAGEDDLDDPQPEPRQSRAQARVEAAIREKREAEARAAELEARLRNIETSTSRASEAQAEEARLAQMEPWERAEYFARRAEERAAQQVNSLRSEMQDQNDRATFAAECAANPRLAKVRDQVEQRLSEARKNGVTLPRRTLAAYIIGETVLSQSPKARAAAEKKAAGNLSRERARPVTGGSDAPTNRTRDERSARLARLEGASI